MADTVLANMLNQSQPIQSANEWVKKYFPVAQNYSIVNDLSFLAMPASEMVIEPIVRNGIAKLGIKDEDIPKYAANMVDAALEKVAKDGSITLFGTIELEDADLRSLRHLLAANLPATETEKYQVIE
jgi:hypothetical protein